MLFSLTSTLFTLIAVAQAVDHAITVGGPGGVVAFSPTSVNAAIGDTVTFTFLQKNHTVTQSSFESPCTPLSGGFDSGFQFVAADNINGPFPAATLTIKDTSPIWVYCRQLNHCAAGMVFAVNPGDGKFEAFQAAAKATGNTASSSTSSASSTISTAPSETTLAPAPEGSSPSGPIDHKILVGDNGSLTFSPANITAQVGDTVTFEFRAKNHTISQSSFSQPCRLLEASAGTAGFDSGFMSVAAGSTSFPTFTFTVNDTKPIWAYCRQTNPVSHCGNGMVFAVNSVESSANNFGAFVALAKELNGTATAGSDSNSPGSNNGATKITTQRGAIAITAWVFGLVFAW